MNRLLLLFASVALVCAAGCGKKDDDEKKETSATTAAKEPAATEPEKPDEPDPEQAKLERGKYLAAISGCELCHTPMGPQGYDTSKLYAGGLEVKEAFGTWRSPNITPHEETGIGSWSDEEIITAVRQGIRPDGKGLFPIMPYMFYSNMSDQDVEALVAYLRTVEPVEHAVERKTDLKMPTADKIPNLPEPTGDHPGEDPVEQGKYLAALAHCGACHLPFDEKKKMPDFSRMFQGGMPFELMEPFGEGVVFAPNLTPHETGLGDWSEDDIVAAIKTMKKKDGKPIVFPMMLYAPAYGAMKDEDARAIAKFLKSLPPAENKIPESKYKLHMPGKGAKKDGPPGKGT